MGNIIEISANLRLPEYELVFSFARSSGKGGQNVNKVNSKAVLNWAPAQSRFISPQIKQRFFDKYSNQISQDGILVLHSDRFRDQPMNIKDCIEKLCQMLLAVEFAPKKRFKTKPTKASRRRRIENKKINSEKKQLRKRIDWCNIFKTSHILHVWVFGRMTQTFALICSDLEPDSGRGIVRSTLIHSK